MKPTYRRAPLGAFTITRIMRETFPLIPAQDGHCSVGTLIDEQLSRLAAEGADIQTITLNMEPEQWEELASAVYGGYVEESR